MKDENAGNMQNYTEADEMRRRRQKVLFHSIISNKILVSVVSETIMTLTIFVLCYFPFFFFFW